MAVAVEQFRAFLKPEGNALFRSQTTPSTFLSGHLILASRHEQIKILKASGLSVNNLYITTLALG